MTHPADRSAPDPAVSVVVLNFNGGELVLRCVASALAQGGDVEVVVVDNGSVDGSLDAVRAHFPEVAVLELGANRGYAAGMDAGIAATRGEVVVPLNCDAVLHPSFAATAVAALDGDDRLGALAPLVVRAAPTGPPVWEDGDAAVLDAGPIDLLPNLSVHLRADLVRPSSCFKPNGAAPVYRRAALDDVVAAYGVGPFDPAFDTYGEDIDLAFKLWARGWQTAYRPDVQAAHVRSFASSPSVFNKRGRLRTLLLASRHVNAWRHLTRRELLVTVPAILAGDIALAAVGMLRGDRGAVGDVVRAWRRAWAQRNEIRAYRRAQPPAVPRPPGVFVWRSLRRDQPTITAQTLADLRRS